MPDVLLAYPSVKSSMINWRAKGCSLPKIPHSMDEFIDQIESDEMLCRFNINNEKFIHIIPSSCERSGKSVALFTLSGIKAIEGKALVDATFKFYPNFVKQLFVIHSYVGNLFFNVNLQV